MAASVNHPLARRAVLTGALVAAGALALPGRAFAQAAAGGAAQAPVQRLMVLATRNAFARLTAPDGFWDSRVARFGLPVLFRKTAANAATPLGQDAFRAQLQHRLNVLAGVGAQGAMAAVIDAAGKLAVPDPQAILHGAPSSGATQLRLAIGSDLVNAMIPPIEQAIGAGQDPIVAQAVASLVGVVSRDVAQAVALAADNGIWYEIGRTEAAIRANPSLAGDPELAAALRPLASPVAPASSPSP